MFSRTARRRNLAFFGLSLIIGLSFFARHIAGMFYTHSHYRCLVYNPKSVRDSPPAPYDFLPDDISWDETRAYARWTNEVLRGELGGATLASFAPYLTSSVPQQPLWLRDRLGPIVLAGMARLPGSDTPTAFLAADLVFPLGAALALFVLCWEMRPSISFAVAATSLVMFFNWQDVLNLAAFLHGARENEAIFLRTPYPQFSTIVFCLFFWCLLRLVRTPTFFHGFLFALLLDVNFLTYFYSWTYALMLAASAFIMLALDIYFPDLHLHVSSTEQRKRALTGVFIATLVAFVAAYPIWRGMIQKNSVTHDDFLRLGGVFSRAPESKYSPVLLLLFPALLMWKQSHWKNRWLAMTLLLASLFALNLQIVTGTAIQPAHWTAYYIQPLFMLVCLDLFWSSTACVKRPALCSAIATVVLIGGISANVYKFSAGAKESVDFNRRDTDFEQVLELLQQPSLRDYGFLSNDEYLSTVLPAFVVQKPLLPWYMDPLTDRELSLLQNAAFRVLHPESSSASSAADATGDGADAAPELALRPDKILFILNLHRPFSETFKNRPVLLKNQDFLVLAPFRPG